MMNVHTIAQNVSLKTPEMKKIGDVLVDDGRGLVKE